MSQNDVNNPFGASSTAEVTSTPLTPAVNRPASHRPQSGASGTTSMQSTFMHHPLMATAAATSAVHQPARAQVPSVPFYTVSPGASRPSVPASAGVHNTVSPVYTGRAVGGFLSEISRSKTLQDHVNDWIHSGLMLFLAGAGEDASKAVKQPAPASPFTILRFYMNAIVTAPQKWHLPDTETAMPTLSELADLVRHRQWGRIAENVRPTSTLISNLISEHPAAMLNDASQTATQQMLSFARSRVAALVGLSKPAAALDEINAVVDFLLAQASKMSSNSDETAKKLQYALLQWLLLMSDAMAAKGSKREACSVCSAITLNVFTDSIAWMPSMRDEKETTRYPSFGKEHADLADPIQAGADAVIAKFTRDCSQDGELSVLARSIALLQNSPSLPNAATLLLLTSAGGRLLNWFSETGFHVASRTVCDNLRALAGCDIDDAELIQLRALHNFAGSALPPVAEHKWILRGLGLYHAGVYLAAYGPLDSLSKVVQELASMQYWSDGMFSSTLTAGEAPTLIVGSDVHSTVTSPANTEAINIASVLSQSLRAQVSIQKRDYEAAQRAAEAAIDISCEVYLARSFAAGSVAFCDKIAMQAEDLVGTACMTLCSASAKRNNPVTCGFTVLDALIRSAPTVFARPELVAAYTGLIDMSGDAAGSLRTKKVLQSVCQIYGLDYLDSRLFRLPST